MATKRATSAPSATVPTTTSTSATDSAETVLIACDQEPFTVDGRRIATIGLKPITFAQWVQSTRSIAGEGDEVDAEFAHRRALMLCRAKATDDRGNNVSLSELDLMTMPRRYAVQLLRRVGQTDAAQMGRVVSAGNGIDRPCIVALGRAIRFTSRSEGVGSIVELEFSANTMAEIAPVVCARNVAEQALALLRTCARQAGTDGRLPDAAVNSIGLEDGLMIMRDVLPSFLDQPAN